MSHIPNSLDVKTDLRRAVMASFSPKAFDDVNTKTFLAKAEENLEIAKKDIGKISYIEARKRILKAKNSKSSLVKRRENLLTASCLI